ncbi:hypothetical protein [Sporomusa carbonis]
MQNTIRRGRVLAVGLKILFFTSTHGGGTRLSADEAAFVAA